MFKILFYLFSSFSKKSEILNIVINVIKYKYSILNSEYLKNKKRIIIKQIVLIILYFIIYATSIAGFKVC